MDRLEEYADEESPYTERNNFQKEPTQKEINNNSFELLQTVKELKIEMESVKKENERILRAQEELNQILMKDFIPREKIKELSLKIWVISIKIKILNKLKLKVAHLLKCMVIHINKSSNILVTVVNIIIILGRESLNLTKKSLGNFKKIKPPTFNGETEKGEEAKS